METEHKTHLKFQLFIKAPMSEDGWKRWGLRQRKHISKCRIVRRPYVSHKDLKGLEGIPTEALKTDQGIGEFLLANFHLDNATYQLHLFTHRKTKTKVGWTKKVATIIIEDSEKKSFTVTDSGNLNRYWFRRTKK